MFVSRLQWFLVPVEKPCQRCEVLLVFCTLVIKSYWVGKCHRFLYLPLAAFYQRFISFDSLSDPGTFNQVKHEKRIEFSHFLSFKRGLPQSLPSFRDCCVGFPPPRSLRRPEIDVDIIFLSRKSGWCFLLVRPLLRYRSGKRATRDETTAAQEEEERARSNRKAASSRRRTADLLSLCLFHFLTSLIVRLERERERRRETKRPGR